MKYHSKIGFLITEDSSKVNINSKHYYPKSMRSAMVYQLGLPEPEPELEPGKRGTREMGNQ